MLGTRGTADFWETVYSWTGKIGVGVQSGRATDTMRRNPSASSGRAG